MGASDTRLAAQRFVILCLGVLAVLCLVVLPQARASSICYGTTSDGRLAGSCKLPAGGENFAAYSRLGRMLGRTYVHCDVAEVVISAYEALASSHPDKRFVYGETGFKNGGEFKPHKTHRNGLSVDFMVPVTDRDGESVPLPTGMTNKLGYGIEFDTEGTYRDLRIDFEAMSAHLTALREAANDKGIGIWRVIFDPDMQQHLKKTSQWPKIADLEYSTRRSWVRHDQHYHIDFDVPCRSLSEWRAGIRESAQERQSAGTSGITHAPTVGWSYLN